MTTTQAATNKIETKLVLVKPAQQDGQIAAQEISPQPGLVKHKILIDLKPALDGYAGIPQESRLLFRGLRMLPGNREVEGLIQHGGRHIRSAVPANRKKISISKKINRLSRVVVSLYETPYSNMFEKALYQINRYFALSLLRLRLLTRRSLVPSEFDSNLFDDFIWHSFFSKTLKPGDKDLVTSARYRILASPRKLLHKVGLAGRKFSSTPNYLKIDTRGFKVFVAQTPFPGRVSKGTQLVVRYHDAVPVLMPHTISDKGFHQASHFYALQENVRAGAWFSCVSEATRKDLLKIFPEAEPRSVVIHNIVSHEYFKEDSAKALVYQVIRNRLATGVEFKTNLSALEFDEKMPGKNEFDYLLMVSTLEPRKNHMLLMHAWEKLKYTSMPKLKLIVVGNAGWDHEPILNAFRPWAERGDLFYLSNIPSAELRVLYKHATATICPSLAEGFDYTGIEAMLSGGIVISSDIPVHREVYENASEYFSPYSSEEAAEVIHRVLGKEGGAIRQRLRETGPQIADRYTSSKILPKWDAFLNKILGE